MPVSGDVAALNEALRAFGPARLIAMAAVALAVAGLLAATILRGGEGPSATLYSELDLREAAQMADQLEAAHIPHRLAQGGSTILVGEADIPRARVLLARGGLPSGGSLGWELFDKSDGLTTTQFQQQITQLRALEGELARTIRAISGVRAARVHLVLPRREPFERDRQDAQAGVMLTMQGAARLDREGVQAVLNLVAAAVPGLRTQNITVVDTRGDVLARAGDGAGAGGATLGLEEARHAIELRLSRAVEDMLERTLGAGRVRAEAAVELDVAQTHETQERFDPEGRVERSTQTVTDNSKTTDAPQTVSVQNNLPNADAGAPGGGGSQQQRQEETSNYEISKTVRTVVREAPEVRRISLAVLVDGGAEPGPEGPHYKPRSAEELAHIEALVKGAIGFDEKRGDKVEVVNMPFTAVAEEAPPAPPRLFGMALGGLDAGRLAQIGVAAVVGLLVVLLVLRPMVRGLVLPQPAQAAGALAGPTAAMGIGGGLQALPGGVAGSGGLLAGPSRQASGGVPDGGSQGAMLALSHDSGGRALTPAGDDEAMVEISSIEGQMRASSIRRLADLVERHPEESLTILRLWIQQEAS